MQHATYKTDARAVRSRPVRRTFTPSQNVGLALLATAEAEANSLQPDMRAFVLWQIGQTYQKVDPAKSELLLARAFLATASVEGKAIEGDCLEEEFCGTKFWLQKHILRKLIQQTRNVDQIYALLLSTEPGVSEQLGTELFWRFVDRKEFDPAHQLLNKFAENSGRYPYGAAMGLMGALPKERSADRLSIFSEALQAFAQEGTDSPQVNDLSTMVSRFWQDLPGSLVLEAVERILERAKEADAVQRDVRVGISSNYGMVYFPSRYQFRLFEILPALEELDPARAEELLSRNNPVGEALERYPKGLESLDTAFHRKELGNEASGVQSVDVITEDRRSASEIEFLQHEINRRQEMVLLEAGKDPQMALLEALSLPTTSPMSTMYSPRAVTLRRLASVVARKDSRVAIAALEEMRRVVAGMPLRYQARMLEDVPQIYVSLREDGAARAMLDELVSISQKLYVLDSDLGDPNQAFKGMWPSTNLWRQCIQFAATLTPSPAEDIIANISDPEIRSLERVGLATALLGGQSPALSIVEKHKNEQHVLIVR
jgi:hypothetical protein